MREAVFFLLFLVPLTGCLSDNTTGPDDEGRVLGGFSLDDEVTFTMKDLPDGADGILLEVQGKASIAFTTTYNVESAALAAAGASNVVFPCGGTGIDELIDPYLPDVAMTGGYVRAVDGTEVDARSPVFGRGFEHSSLLVSPALRAQAGVMAWSGLEHLHEQSAMNAWSFHVSSNEPFYWRIAGYAHVECLNDLSQTDGGKVIASGDVVRVADAQWLADSHGRARIFGQALATSPIQASLSTPSLGAMDAYDLLDDNGTFLVFDDAPGEVQLDLDEFSSEGTWRLRVAVASFADTN